jgi:hypothetical protein
VKHFTTLSLIKLRAAKCNFPHSIVNSYLMRTICLALLLFLAYASDNVEVTNIDPGSADCGDSDSGTISEPYQCSGMASSIKPMIMAVPISLN